MNEENINRLITDKENGIDANLISDGYHTFGELYEHRITLFITLCRIALEVKHYASYGDFACDVWRSALHSDGSAIDGWFVLGISKERGGQITYHLPMSHWGECDFAETLTRAPEFDGHTPADVLDRLRKL